MNMMNGDTDKMKKTTIDILKHIFDTACLYPDVESCKNIDVFTNGHYFGPGFIMSFDFKDGDDFVESSIVFDMNKNYVGTMSWIDKRSNNGWFNDVNPNWMDDEVIWANIKRFEEK